jgi:rod shape-determining protein MreD
VRALFAGPVLRLLSVGIVVLAIQRTVAAESTIGDVRVQIVLALVAGAGAGAGGERGAFAGFVLGLMYDLGVGSPLGLTALCYGIAGLVAGYAISVTPDPQWWLAMIFAALGAAIGEASIPIVRLLTGEAGWVDSRMIPPVVVAAISTAILSPLFVPLGRWCAGAKRKKWKAMIE